jgi:hypothetical protein
MEIKDEQHDRDNVETRIHDAALTKIHIIWQQVSDESSVLCEFLGFSYSDE